MAKTDYLITVLAGSGTGNVSQLYEVKPSLEECFQWVEQNVLQVRSRYEQIAWSASVSKGLLRQCTLTWESIEQAIALNTAVPIISNIDLVMIQSAETAIDAFSGLLEEGNQISQAHLDAIEKLKR